MHLYKITIFVAVVLFLMGIILFIFPEKGLKVTDEFTLKYPTYQELFTPDTTKTEERVENIIENIVDIDSITNEQPSKETLEEQKKRDSLLAIIRADSLRQWQLKIHYPNDDPSLLYSFFDKLENAKNRKRPLRILHYGDSQIEGDRISGYIRSKLQGRFGGAGPGLVAAVPLVPSMSVSQKLSDGWIRYTAYGKKDSTVQHKRYGILGSFGRFGPILPDSIQNDSLIYKAEITFNPNRYGFENTKSFNHFQMFYGYQKDTVLFQMLEGDDLLERDTLLPSDGVKRFSYDFDHTPKNLKVKFSGKDSPEFYGFALDGNGGIALDNIAWRGSSGTIFRKISGKLLREMYGQLDIGAIILQFGGNVMPYIEDEEEAKEYGRWFKSQISYLKRIVPGVTIIVIGPSDMSMKIKDEFKTYPLLESVRDALKNASFEAGAAYWDLYEAMGGKNSMPVWVNAEPPLAAKDYIHFNRKGAKKAAQMFYNALIKDFNSYKKGGKDE